MSVIKQNQNYGGYLLANQKVQTGSTTVAAQKLAGGQQASSKKLGPEELQENLESMHTFYNKDSKSFTPVKPEKPDETSKDKSSEPAGDKEVSFSPARQKEMREAIDKVSKDIEPERKAASDKASAKWESMIFDDNTGTGPAEEKASASVKEVMGKSEDDLSSMPVTSVKGNIENAPPETMDKLRSIDENLNKNNDIKSLEAEVSRILLNDAFVKNNDKKLFDINVTANYDVKIADKNLCKQFKDQGININEGSAIYNGGPLGLTVINTPVKESDVGKTPVETLFNSRAGNDMEVIALTPDGTRTTYLARKDLTNPDRLHLRGKGGIFGKEGYGYTNKVNLDGEISYESDILARNDAPNGFQYETISMMNTRVTTQGEEIAIKIFLPGGRER